MHLLTNIVAFQIAWLLCVLGAANQMPWLGPIAVVVALSLHLQAARKPFDEILLAIACAIVGIGFDSALVTAGWVSYEAGSVSDYLAPYWIIAMWVSFATTLNVSLRWLRAKPKLAALFGFLGGPSAYLTGQQLGGIVFDNQAAALIALALGWAIVMPLLMWLSENLDGMPGKRRNWVAEVAP